MFMRDQGVGFIHLQFETSIEAFKSKNVSPDDIHKVRQTKM